MTSKSIFLTALCICAVISCSKVGQETDNPTGGKTLEAFLGDDNIDTKTAWAAGDQISLFFGSGNNGGNRFTTSQGGQKASFSGTINTSNKTGGTTYYWGVSPYMSTATCDNNSVTVNIPSEQTGVAGTVAPNVNISVGRSENLKMGFYNICSGISFSVTEAGITEVIFKSGDDSPLVGDAKVEYISGKPSVTGLSNASSEVHVLPEGGEFKAGQMYYLEIVPGNLKGFTVTLYNNKMQEATYEYTSSKDFARGKFMSLSNIDTSPGMGEWTSCEGTVEFKDANFKAYCVQNFDTNGDGDISYAEASVVKKINCPEKKISSMDGIEFFTSLESLYCQGNQLTSLDLSRNTALTELICSSNELTSLDLSSNSALTVLDCYYNKLTSLDVSKNTALTKLTCDSNQLTSLNVSKNTALTELICATNKLTALDVSKNTALTRLNCCINELTVLDLSKNTALTYLNCYYNKLIRLDVSNNSALTSLDCNYNQLTALDISKSTALTYLDCHFNQLTALDVSKNTVLTYINCNSNNLTTLDVSRNTDLQGLYCYLNQISSLDVSKNTALTNLYCSPMTAGSGQDFLKTLYIYDGQKIEGVTFNRSKDHIPDTTSIVVKAS